MVSPDAKQTCPLPFHLTLLRSSTLMFYLVISTALKAAFPTSYRVLMFKVPILVLSLIDRRIVGALTSRWLSPAHVMSSSCEPSSLLMRCCCGVCSTAIFMERSCCLSPNPDGLMFSVRVFLPLITGSGYLKAPKARLSPLSFSYRCISMVTLARREV